MEVHVKNLKKKFGKKNRKKMLTILFVATWTTLSVSMQVWGPNKEHNFGRLQIDGYQNVVVFSKSYTNAAKQFSRQLVLLRWCCCCLHLILIGVVFILDVIYEIVVYGQKSEALVSDFQQITYVQFNRKLAHKYICTNAKYNKR